MAPTPWAIKTRKRVRRLGRSARGASIRMARRWPLSPGGPSSATGAAPRGERPRETVIAVGRRPDWSPWPISVPPPRRAVPRRPYGKRLTVGDAASSILDRRTYLATSTDLSTGGLIARWNGYTTTRALGRCVATGNARTARSYRPTYARNYSRRDANGGIRTARTLWRCSPTTTGGRAGTGYATGATNSA